MSRWNEEEGKWEVEESLAPTAWQEAEHLRWQNESDKKESTWNAVREDIRKREQLGVLKYGKYLTKHTTEDTLQHLYEELLDAVVYIKTEILKRGDHLN